MGRKTDSLDYFAKQICRRVHQIDDKGLANAFMSLSATLQYTGRALRDIYDEVHEVKKMVEKNNRR